MRVILEISTRRLEATKHINSSQHPHYSSHRSRSRWRKLDPGWLMTRPAHAGDSVIGVLPYFTTVVSSWVIVCVECVAVIVSVVAGGQREMFCYYFYCLPCRDLPSVSKHLQTSHHLPGPVPVMSLIDGGSLSGQKVCGTCPGDRDWEWMISGTERVRVFYNWSTSCLYYCRPN